MALTIFEQTFGRDRNRFSKVSNREATTEHLIAITAAVQAVVDTFRDPHTGDRYLVALSDKTEAFTIPGTKRIVVSYKPIFDKGLKVSTAATVMTGLVLHEIGHTLYTFPNLPAIEAAFGKPGRTEYDPITRRQVNPFDQLAYSMLNVGDDARLEARMSEQLPVARDIFPTMLHWVAITTEMVGERLRWTGKSMKMVDRVNFAGRAARYPWTATWSSDTATRAERQWWIEWAREYKALDDRDDAGMVRLVKVALDRLRNAEEVIATDPEPDITCGPVGPTGPKPEGEAEDEAEGEGTKGKSKDPFGDDFDKDEDGDDAGSDEDEADDDESDLDPDIDDDWTEGDDRGGNNHPGIEDEDEPDDAESDDFEPGEGPDGPDEDEDADDDEPGGSKTDAPSTDDGEGKEGEPDGDPGKTGQVGDGEPDDEDEGFPQDFDAHDLKGNLDRINRGDDNWRDRENGTLLQRAVDVAATTERIATSRWGSAKVEVRSIGQVANNQTRIRPY